MIELPLLNEAFLKDVSPLFQLSNQRPLCPFPQWTIGESRWTNVPLAANGSPSLSFSLPVPAFSFPF